MKETLPISQHNNEYEVRKKKAVDLKNEGINPWPNFTFEKELISDIKKNKITLLEKNKKHSISGRIISIREHGKSIFISIKDTVDIMQGYIKKEDSTESMFLFIQKYLDTGDIIHLEGHLFLTKTEELTIRIEHITLLSKCLHFIPDEHTGLENIETRYRQRYLDIIVNPGVKEIFKKRTYLIQHIRNMLDTRGYLEVETPILQPIAGGAAAKPFITHHNALNTKLYLRIAPELYLKRMIVGGFDKVYEINRNFRNEGVSIRHNPEFTMLEFYTAYQNYTWAMNFVEEIIKTSCWHLNKSFITKWNDHELNFELQFDRLTAKEAIIKYTHITESDLKPEHIDQFIPLSQIKLSYEEKIFFIFEEEAEKKLIHPTFLIDFPIALSPLAKEDPSNNLIASRFELFICGMEIANGYNELNDPFDQKSRFLDQVQKKESGNEEAMFYDEDFIKALEHGMSPTAGVGIGIDRLCMLLTGAKSIKDVILFPTMKPINE
jgi:lysyl-tRNA synthetase class 2